MNPLPYDICVALRNANFPHDWKEFDDHDKELLMADWTIYGKGYSPTLEELIEACGEKFYSLHTAESWTETKWFATLHHDDRKLVTGGVCEGKTPSEAVASLYLAITK